MIYVAYVLFLIGLAGLVWGTLGSSFAAYLLGRQRLSPAPARATPLRLDLMITAYNEEAVIRKTLESLEGSLLAFQAEHGDLIDARIVVGLDHCTDSTAAIVAEFAGQSAWPVRMIENTGDRGKWAVLLALTRVCDADWLAFIDAGSLWDPSLLIRAWPQINQPSVMAVAPSYAPSRAGLLERLNWRLERFLKTLENRAGGPVSVHGATVLYEREALVGTLTELADRVWHTDDVAIPVTLRFNNPDRKIVYLSGAPHEGFVTDIGIRSEAAIEYRRRGRILIGNLQWIRAIFFPRLGDDFFVTLIASRRVFRTLWAYWVLLIGVSGGILAVGLVSQAMESAEYRIWALVLASLLGVAVIAELIFSSWIRRLTMAFLSGLMVPRLWKQMDEERNVQWS